LAQKVGRIVGVTLVYVLAILLLIGLVVWLTTSGALKPAPSSPVPVPPKQVCVQSGPYGQSKCHNER
jgi:protein-S-isoprenylcysteine O-methyltransferase Ste14